MTQNPESQAGKAITGGEWLIRKTAASDIFIPEEWNEEQRMMKQMTEDFIAQNVHNQLDAIDDQQEGLIESLMEKSGELGLLGTSVPEELGGMGLDFKTTMLITEALGDCLLYTSPSPRDLSTSRMPSSA